MSAFRTQHVVWLVLAPVLAVFLAGAVGYSPTRSIGGGPAIVAMCVACGLSALAAVLGSIPVIWAAYRLPERLPVLALASTMLRMAVLVVMTVPVVLLAGLDFRVLLVWVGIGYVVALGAEIVALVFLIRRMEARK